MGYLLKCALGVLYLASMTFLWLVLFPDTAFADEPESHAASELSWFDKHGAHACPGVIVSYLCAGAALVATPLGVRAARRPGSWPHWRRLVGGLGEGAFLFALMSAFLSLGSAYGTIQKMGSAVTPPHIAEGFMELYWDASVAAGAALVALLGRAAIRAAEPRAA